ncbi:unnamed protein product [Linum trigynum]|uniref:Uncharacterized protein n=1 Tax=Linum trigynum TaxID=586398 RepID=A0AAV2E786_9ROSI
MRDLMQIRFRLAQLRLRDANDEEEEEAEEEEEEEASTMNEQEDKEDPLIEELACKTIIAPKHQEEETKQGSIDGVERKEEESKEEKEFDTQHEKNTSLEGKEFENAIGVQPMDKVEVDEASTKYAYYSSFPRP